MVTALLSEIIHVQLGKLHTLVFANDLHQLFTARKRRQILPLLLQRPSLGKGTNPGGSLQMTGKLGIATIAILSFSFSFLRLTLLLG